MSSLAEPRPQHRLNDWLVGQLIHQNINSLDALAARAHKFLGFKRTWESMQVVAKVWNDRGNLQGYVSQFERELLMATDARRAGNAFLVLAEIRWRWRRGKQFALTATAKRRGICPHIGRKPFEGAVSLLVETGCIEKVSGFRRDHRGNHDAAQYILTPTRETGEVPAVKQPTPREVPKQQGAEVHQQREVKQTEEVRQEAEQAQEAQEHEPGPTVFERYDLCLKKIEAILSPDEGVGPHAKLLADVFNSRRGKKECLVPDDIWLVWLKADIEVCRWSLMTEAEKKFMTEMSQFYGSMDADFSFQLLMRYRKGTLNPPPEEDEEPKPEFPGNIPGLSGFGKTAESLVH